MTKLDRIKSSTSAVGNRIVAVASTPSVTRALAKHRPIRQEPFPFVLYFADVPSSLYQVRQWLRPLEALDSEVGRVALLVRNPLVIQQLRGDTHLAMALTGASAMVEEFASRHGVRVIFYVNNNQANFTTLRINGPAHVHLSHGESEKVSMVSHQLKAYDFVFVAGQASEDRIRRHVPRLDTQQIMHIGRPQLHESDHNATAPRSSDRISVLYAPTWEGDSKEMSYSSLLSHGLPLVKLLINDPRVRLVFRPHPKMGVNSAVYRSALRSILKMLNHKSARKSGHRVDHGKDPIAELVSSDVAICDISAMAMDAIGLERPLILCFSGMPTSEGLMQNVPSWRGSIPVDPGRELVSLARSAVSSCQQSYRTYIFGPGTPADAVRRFTESSRLVANL